MPKYNPELIYIDRSGSVHRDNEWQRRAEILAGLYPRAERHVFSWGVDDDHPGVGTNIDAVIKHAAGRQALVITDGQIRAVDLPENIRIRIIVNPAYARVYRVESTPHGDRLAWLR